MIPTFVVVGHPNKGKSSIVATLAEDDAVPISALPGTTTEARRYPLSIDGETLYELVDTPGFQRPRETLAWLESHLPATHERSKTVADFVAEHRGDPRFHDECALLEPVLESAGVLYVVDGSKPYGPEYEAEMEVLRWAGQPRMALINPISGTDYVEEWRRALDQFFAIVRVFDATRADFDKRISLLRAFNELATPTWQPQIQRAEQALRAEREHRRTQSAAELAALLVDVLTHRVRRQIAPDADTERAREQLLETLLEQIRTRENRARTQIEGIYRHSGLHREESAARLLTTNLFSEESWQVFGLSTTQLATAGAVSGALAGGGIDALLGGASLLLGAAAGAVIGGVGVLLGSQQLARTKVLGLPLGGREVIVGPVRDPNFPWVILGRALLHQRMIAERNHARREAMVLDRSSTAGERNAGRESDGLENDIAESGPNLVASIPSDARRGLDQLFAALRGQEGAEPQQRRDLETQVHALLGP